MKKVAKVGVPRIRKRGIGYEFSIDGVNDQSMSYFESKGIRNG